MTQVYAVVTRDNTDTEELTRAQYDLYCRNKHGRERRTYDKYGRVRRIHSRDGSNVTIHTFTFPGKYQG